LREMGVGDVVIPKRMNKIAEAFMGRVKAYGEAFDNDVAALSEVLERNVTGKAVSATALAEKVMKLDQLFQNDTLEQLLSRTELF
jgi:cytochrome b pre-mRNA-processing protein 3